MPRHVRLRELLVGVEGLALLRHLYDGSDEDAAERIDEVSRIVTDTEFTTGELIAETDAREGYDAWSSHYDGTDNPVIELEEPVVWSILESIPPGRALDVACGTGRHAGKLVTHGHSVVGVDYTRAMLSVARRELPSAVFAEAGRAKSSWRVSMKCRLRVRSRCLSQVAGSASWVRAMKRVMAASNSS